VVKLLKLRQKQLRGLVATISGWNVGLSSSEAAGKTKFHAHWHLF
jgi:diadenosine tetraphosphate (Ap4A) HIT family hydrolase